MALLRNLPALLAGTAWVLSGLAQTAGPWPQLRLATRSSVPQPTGITHAGDGSGRIFVTSQTGRIYVDQSGVASVFLDIVSRVLSGGERGLLGLAFPPNYAVKQYFYVAYTRKPDGAGVVARFRVPSGSSVADPVSEEVLLTVPQTYANHNGGQLAFGPDGFLYVGKGDGGYGPFDSGDPENNAQNPNSLLGKILRLDVESGVQPYGIPPTNPYAGQSGYRPEIWALGLRNPWRFSFDRQTGDLYIADVGHNAYEELNRQPAGVGGQNYGWRVREGTHDYIVPPGFDFSTLTPPILEFSHADVTTIIGGHFYRGPAVAKFQNTYFCADFSRGNLLGARQVDGNWVSQRLDTSEYLAISALGEDEAGNLYAADYNGTIRQLVNHDEVFPPTLISAPIQSETFVLAASCRTTGATLRFTTDGSTPTDTSPVFLPDSVVIDRNTTIQMQAFKDGLQPSPVVTRRYSLRVFTPSISPYGGAIDPASGIQISIGTPTQGATLRYTLDGSNPDENSTLYVGPFRIALGNVTLRAIGLREGWDHSNVASTTYQYFSLTEPTLAVSGAPGPANPVALLAPRGKIRYTLDGSPPTESSPLYFAPLAVYSTVTISARAFPDADGYDPSSTTRATYSPNLPQAGQASPAAGTTAGFVDAGVAAAAFRDLEGVCLGPDGAVYVADTGNHAIRRVIPGGQVTTLAGNGQPGFAEGSGGSARFNSPRGICCDAAGNLFVADDGNARIRRVTPAGEVTTFAGSGVVGTADGPASTARFQTMGHIQLLPDGALVVGSNNALRRVEPDGTVSTLAQLPVTGRVALAVGPTGRLWAAAGGPVIYERNSRGALVPFAGSTAGYSDERLSSARFTAVRGLFCDRLGALHAVDDNRIRKLRPDGLVVTLGPIALSNPNGIVVDNTNGAVWIASTGAHRLLRFQPKDWDDDLIDDALEQPTTLFTLGVDDRLVDLDGDGTSNAFEYLAGTHMLLSSDVLRPSLALGVNGLPALQWPSVQGVSYRVEYSDDLHSWNYFTRVLGTGQVMTVSDPYAAGRRYYRLAFP